MIKNNGVDYDSWKLSILEHEDPWCEYCGSDCTCDLEREGDEEYSRMKDEREDDNE